MPSVRDRIAQLETASKGSSIASETEPPTQPENTMVVEDPEEDDLIDRTTTVDSHEQGSEQTVSSLGTETEPDFPTTTTAPVAATPAWLAQAPVQIMQQPAAASEEQPSAAWLAQAPVPMETPVETPVEPAPTPVAVPSWLAKAQQVQAAQPALIPEPAVEEEPVAPTVVEEPAVAEEEPTVEEEPPVEEEEEEPTMEPDETELARQVSSVDETELARQVSSTEEEEDVVVVETPSMDTRTTPGQAFDRALAQSQDYTTPATTTEGGLLWKAAAAEQEPTEAEPETSVLPTGDVSEAKAREPEEAAPTAVAAPTEPSSNQSVASASVGGPFDRALAQPEETSSPQEVETGGVLWMQAAQASASEEAPQEAIAATPDAQEAPESFEDEHAAPETEQSRALPPTEPPIPHDTTKVVTLEESLAKPDGPFPSVKSPRKRRHLVQLLIVGAWATLVGLLGNIYLGFSCYFAAVEVQVGAYSAELDLHYGLWVYSPAQSAMVGYKYCQAYDDNQESPLLAQVFHLAASAAGLFSLGVLWYYMISGVVSSGFWSAGMWSCVLATLLQLLVFLFFTTETCREEGCDWGIGSSIVLVTAFAWMILAMEMRHQRSNLGIGARPTASPKRVEMTTVNSQKYRPMSDDSSYTPPAMS